MERATAFVSDADDTRNIVFVINFGWEISIEFGLSWVIVFGKDLGNSEVFYEVPQTKDAAKFLDLGLVWCNDDEVFDDDVNLYWPVRGQFDK